MNWNAEEPEMRPLSAEPVEMVAIDLDGTLLRSDGSICAPSAEAIHNAMERGVRIVLASGRAPRKVLPIAEALGIKNWLICHNGAVIIDPVSRQTIVNETMPPILARKVVELARKVAPKVAIGVDVDGRTYTETAKKRNAKAVAPAAQIAAGGSGAGVAVAGAGSAVAPAAENRQKKSDTTANLPGDPRSIEASGMRESNGSLADALNRPVTKVMMIGEEHVLGGIQMALQQQLADHVGFSFSDLRLLQVVRGDVDKSGAVSKVAEHYGIQRSSVMTIGDAPNDIGMLQWAGLGIAMGNAWDDVRRAAHFTVANNDNGGVAEALRKYAV